MANCLLAYPNIGDLATLSGGSFALPITKLQNGISKDFARTTNAANGSFVVNGVFTKLRPMRVIVLYRHNFSVDATYRIRIYSDAALSSLQYDSGVLPVFPIVYTEENASWDGGNLWDLQLTAEDREGLTAQLIHILPDEYTERSFKIEVFDSANPDGFLQAGRIFIGSGWIPVNNMAYGASIGFESRSLVDEAIGGAEYFDERESARVARFSLPNTSEDEAMGMAFELMRKQGTTRDVFYMWDVQDTVSILRRSFLGRLRELSAIEHDFFDNYSVQFEVKEKI